ncbi:MAG TPA: ABC transporter substrate-binding protein, partial [Bryobacteraceae bacterium]|nr:ABC transporter substrate-binding protein [Bryobacteraceae bacterium]
KMMEAILSGEGDVATVNYDALLPLAAQKRDVAAFLFLAKRPGSVLASLRLDSVTALRGAIIGIPGPGSSSHHLLNAILRKAGIEPDRVSTTAVGVSAGAVAAVSQGKVDAAMLTNLGLSTLRLKHPDIRILADLRTPEGSLRYLGGEEYPSLCLAARRAWLESNRETARRFAQAFLKANQWMSQHTPQQIRDALPEQARSSGSTADLEAIRGMLPTLDTQGGVPEQALRTVLNVVQASVPQVRESPLDLSSTYFAP